MNATDRAAFMGGIKQASMSIEGHVPRAALMAIAECVADNFTDVLAAAEAMRLVGTFGHSVACDAILRAVRDAA